jgi:hypothetical protein
MLQELRLQGYLQPQWVTCLNFSYRCVDAHGRVSTVLVTFANQPIPLPLQLSSPTVVALDGADNIYAVENGYRVTRY